jgi:hypothetical protein
MIRSSRILLGQLMSNGDCVFATTIARQIKLDYPGCHLTWAIGSPYRQILDNNPFVDDIWEVPMRSRTEIDTLWPEFAKQANARKAKGDFDLLFLTQTNPANYRFFDGTIRASLFRAYPHPITVPVTPVLRLRQEEKDSALEFVRQTKLAQYTNRILFECSSSSGQSFVTPEFAAAAARCVLTKVLDAAFVLTSHTQIQSSDERIIDGSVLTFRQNAALTHTCTLLVGCSSGITWLATSEAAKPLPSVQLLLGSTSVFASPVHDAEYFGLPTDGILEMTDCQPDHLAECLISIFTEGFPAARLKYHEHIPVRLDFYMSVFILSLLKNFRFADVVRSLRCVVRRYGSGPLFRFAFDRIASWFKSSPHPHTRQGTA